MIVPGAILPFKKCGKKPRSPKLDNWTHSACRVRSEAKNSSENQVGLNRDPQNEDNDAIKKKKTPPGDSRSDLFIP